MTWVFIFRLVVAGLLGTVVGIEREWRVKEAGFRTHFLVSLGSALFMIVSQWGFEEFLAYHDGLRLDPSRVAAQVVSGIGFIGAGAIIFHRQIVRGLTTAASLWAIAGVGMATGTGMYGVAAAATVLTLVGLEVLNLIFGGLGGAPYGARLLAVEREAIQEALELLRTRGYGIVSYELESERTASGIIYRANLLLQARKSRKGRCFRRVVAAGPAHPGGADRLTENARERSVAETCVDTKKTLGIRKCESRAALSAERALPPLRRMRISSGKRWPSVWLRGRAWRIRCRAGRASS